MAKWWNECIRCSTIPGHRADLVLRIPRDWKTTGPLDLTHTEQGGGGGGNELIVTISKKWAYLSICESVAYSYTRHTNPKGCQASLPCFEKWPPIDRAFLFFPRPQPGCRVAGKVHLASALERHWRLECTGLLHFRTFPFSLQISWSLRQHVGLLFLPNAWIRKEKGERTRGVRWRWRGRGRLETGASTFCSRARGSWAILARLNSWEKDLVWSEGEWGDVRIRYVEIESRRGACIVVVGQPTSLCFACR